MAIAASAPDAEIAVIGGGFTGVEAASELAEQRLEATITLYCAGDLLANMRPSARKSIRTALRRKGIRIVERVPVVDIEANLIRLGNGGLHPFDVCLVAAAFDVPELAAAQRPSGRRARSAAGRRHAAMRRAPAT